LVVAEIIKNVIGAPGFVAADTADAAVDGLPLEAGLGRSDLSDDVTSCELGAPGALVEPVDGVEDGGSAAWPGVGDPGLWWWDGDGGSVNDVVAVRIV
jgi:hypothetical protein